MNAVQPPATMRTKRLQLRPFHKDDAPAVFRYASDPRVTRYMEWPTHRTISDSRAFIELVERDASEAGERTWALVLHDTSELIGAASCHPEGHRASFGYALAQHAWGKGFATEAASEIVGWLEGHTPIVRIWATCDVDNAASARVLEKAGLAREGILKSWSKRPNLPGSPIRDAYCYSRVCGPA